MEFDTDAFDTGAFGYPVFLLYIQDKELHTRMGKLIQ